MGLQGIQSVSATAYMEDRQVDPQLGQSAYMKSSYMIRGLTDEICQPVGCCSIISYRLGWISSDPTLPPIRLALFQSLTPGIMRATRTERQPGSNAVVYLNADRPLRR